MKVFITGGTGFVGSAVVQELVANGFEVVGLARSETSAQKLISWGAQPVRGSLTSLSTLATAAAQADAIIHLGFNNDFRHFFQAGAMDRRAIETMGRAISGTNKPLVVTYGTTGIRKHVETEHEVADTGLLKWLTPRKSEIVARQLMAQNINAFVVRLSPAVHGAGDKGFTRTVIERAKKSHRDEYFGLGTHAWSAVHRLDAAHLFYLVTMYGLEHPTTNERVFNAVAEESITTAAIARTISRKLNVPLKAKYNPLSFGDTAMLYLINCPTSSQLTRQILGWVPVQPDLLTDISSSRY